jgi:hypothetical protein
MRLTARTFVDYTDPLSEESKMSGVRQLNKENVIAR